MPTLAQVAASAIVHRTDRENAMEVPYNRKLGAAGFALGAGLERLALKLGSGGSIMRRSAGAAVRRHAVDGSPSTSKSKRRVILELVNEAVLLSPPCSDVSIWLALVQYPRNVICVEPDFNQLKPVQYVSLSCGPHPDASPTARVRGLGGHIGNRQGRARGSRSARGPRAIGRQGQTPRRPKHPSPKTLADAASPSLQTSPRPLARPPGPSPSQCTPRETCNVAGSAPIRRIAVSHNRSAGVLKISSRSTSLINQADSWISASSWPGPQPE